MAIIASSADLGSVTALWHQPALYARFLDQELELVYHGPLVVVMPNGVGVAGDGRVRPALRNALSSAALAQAFRAAPGSSASPWIRSGRWLAATGHPISVGSVRRPRAAGVDCVAIVVLAVGTAAIALCWALSLIARPRGAGLPHP